MTQIAAKAGGKANTGPKQEWVSCTAAASRLTVATFWG